MNAKRVLGSMMLAVLGGIVAIVLYNFLDHEETVTVVQESPRARYISLPQRSSAAPSDFTVAAESAVDAVVHVKTKAFREGSGNPFYDFFFGYKDDSNEPRIVGYGSGVILTSDGYFLLPNDIVYVEPVQSKTFRINIPTFSLFLTSVSTLILVLNFINK